MSVLYIALPLALVLGAAGLFACIYCIRDGQFDDLDSPPLRMLLDDRQTRDEPGDHRQSPEVNCSSENS